MYGASQLAHVAYVSPTGHCLLGCRERAALMYAHLPYISAVAFVELPYLLAQVLVFVPISYFMIGEHSRPAALSSQS